MIMTLTFFLGLKHLTRSSASLAMSNKPIVVPRVADAPAPEGPRSYNSCILFRMRSYARRHETHTVSRASRANITFFICPSLNASSSSSRVSRVASLASPRAHVRGHGERARIVRRVHALRLAHRRARPVGRRFASPSAASQPLKNDDTARAHSFIHSLAPECATPTARPTACRPRAPNASVVSVHPSRVVVHPSRRRRDERRQRWLARAARRVHRGRPRRARDDGGRTETFVASRSRAVRARGAAVEIVRQAGVRVSEFAG